MNKQMYSNIANSRWDMHPQFIHSFSHSFTIYWSDLTLNDRLNKIHILCPMEFTESMKTDIKQAYEVFVTNNKVDEWAVEKNKSIDENGIILEREVRKLPEKEPFKQSRPSIERNISYSDNSKCHQRVARTKRKPVTRGRESEEWRRQQMRSKAIAAVITEGSFKAKVRSLYFIPTTCKGFNTKEYMI